MKNKLSNLNDHLFVQMERLNADGMTAKQIEKEVTRAKAIVAVSDQIVDNANVQLSAARLYAEHGDRMVPHLPMIGKATGS